MGAPTVSAHGVHRKTYLACGRLGALSPIQAPEPRPIRPVGRASRKFVGCCSGAAALGGTPNGSARVRPRRSRRQCYLACGCPRGCSLIQAQEVGPLRPLGRASQKLLCLCSSAAAFDGTPHGSVRALSYARLTSFCCGWFLLQRGAGGQAQGPWCSLVGGRSRA